MCYKALCLYLTSANVGLPFFGLPYLTCLYLLWRWKIIYIFKLRTGVRLLHNALSILVQFRCIMVQEDMITLWLVTVRYVYIYSRNKKLQNSRNHKQILAGVKYGGSDMFCWCVVPELHEFLIIIYQLVDNNKDDIYFSVPEAYVCMWRSRCNTLTPKCQ